MKTNPIPTENTMTANIDSESRILKAIMQRYNGLSMLHSAINEDEDNVLLNLSDDLNDEISEREILNYIHIALAF